MASHRAAARLWDFPGFADAPIEVTAVRHRRRFRSDVVWHESVRLDESNVAVVDGIPLTRPARTIIDLGSVMTAEQVTAALDDAVRRKLTSINSLRRQLEHLGPQRRGSRVVRRALDSRTSGAVAESVLESEFDALIARLGLPAPCRQWPLRDRLGRTVMRIDFAYPVARVAIEIDGVRFHAGPDEWRDDIARQNSVMSQGWRMLRFTARDVRERPDLVDETIREALSHRDAFLNPRGEGEKRNRG